jgi:hypothetical protein
MAILLCCLVSTAAAGTRLVPPGSPAEARVAEGRTTRVVFPEEVRRVVPAIRNLSMMIDGRSLYLKPLAALPERRTLFVTTAGGVRELTLVFGEQHDTTVWIVSDRKGGGTAPRIRERPGFGNGPACLLRHLAGGPRCPGAVRSRPPAGNEVMYRDGFLEIRARTVLGLGPWRAVAATVSNRLSRPLRLSAREMAFPGAVAVALERERLGVSGPLRETTLYLVIDRRLLP